MPGTDLGRSPLRGAALAALVALVVLATGCNYSFKAGGINFPDYIETVAILPFDNETTRLELSQELHAALLRDLPPALGLRSGGEAVAQAVVRGTITGYDLTTPNYRPDASGERAEVLQRQVVIVVRVEIIDTVENVILWEGSSIRAEGAYLEASESEETGKEIALELIVQRIVDGAQSNW